MLPYQERTVLEIAHAVCCTYYTEGMRAELAARFGTVGKSLLFTSREGE